MMKKDVLVTIKDSHITDDNKESYEMTTRGTFAGNESEYIIEYDEQYDALKGCHTTLTVRDGKCVSIVRTGAYPSELVIERGKRHNCQYNTPYGSMLIGIAAQKVNSDIVDGKGSLELKYTIDFYGGVANQTEMTISIE